jgi:hypothetical protein
LVVAGGVDGELAEESPGAALMMMRTCRSWMSSSTLVRARFRPTPMWWSRLATRRVTQPVWSTRLVRTRSSVSQARSAAGVALGRGVDGSWGCSLGLGRVGPVLVALGGEAVEQLCSWPLVVGWAGWMPSHFFSVCWKRSTLPGHAIRR